MPPPLGGSLESDGFQLGCRQPAAPSILQAEGGREGGRKKLKDGKTIGVWSWNESISAQIWPIEQRTIFFKTGRMVGGPSVEVTNERALEVD